MVGNVENKKVPILYVKKEKCCGCTACYSVCPVEAINMKYDKEGFAYPKIDKDKCIGCLKCMGVCPVKVFSHDD